MDFSHARSFGPKPKYPNVLKYKSLDNLFIKIAGPCSVESIDHIWMMAELVAKAGGTHLRGGCYRAGTYGANGIGWIQTRTIEEFHKAANYHGLKNIIEIMEYSSHTMNVVEKFADCFQVGARAQQHYALLKTLAEYEKPVFLKRNTGCTVDEWLGSAEYILSRGKVKSLYLIERGSSTFHNDVRWTPTIHVIPSVKSICNIPVIIDGSHSTGRRDLVEAITYAGVAAGAGGVLVECHNKPEASLSDSEQALDVKRLKHILKRVDLIRNQLEKFIDEP